MMKSATIGQVSYIYTLNLDILINIKNLISFQSFIL